MQSNSGSVLLCPKYHFWEVLFGAWDDAPTNWAIQPGWLGVDINLKIIFPQKYRFIVTYVVLDEKSDANVVFIPL